ncbi:type II secretion system minor pseudopilin GspK [Amphibiibacter pelophylacis]|uniref:Type II secretion system minor pseudopilin GspK n=1 Tax=Amphibiibacter pelophylacis TaxID=1799477 RepID=A0ACC6P3S0_9BURK
MRWRQRGAALLLALLTVSVITTLAAGLVWQQWRSLQVETAERARGQADWLLTGALDWAMLILREDARSSSVDTLGEPWAVPLAESRLSTFLAAGQGGDGATANATDSSSLPDAFLSGHIEDAQAAYNLRNLIARDPATGKDIISPVELAVVQRLCEQAKVGRETAGQIAQGLLRAWGASEDGNAPLPPRRFDDLRWLGVTPAVLDALRPWLTLLPVVTPVNVNTAPREVLAALLDLPLGAAQQLVQDRATRPWNGIPALRQSLPPSVPDSLLTSARVAVSTRFFRVTGRLRMDDLVLEKESLVLRMGLQLTALDTQTRLQTP